jgi:hypothetical protein
MKRILYITTTTLVALVMFFAGDYVGFGRGFERGYFQASCEIFAQAIGHNPEEVCR